MPRWLQGMFAPTLMLWLYAIAIGTASGMSHDGNLSWSAVYVSKAALALMIAGWVTADARKRHWRDCYDHDSFVFFAWPIVAPVYLFRTRGPRAFLTLLCFGGIMLVAILIASALVVVRVVVLQDT